MWWWHRPVSEVPASTTSMDPCSSPGAGPPGSLEAHGRCMALWERHIASLVPHPLLCAGSEDRRMAVSVSELEYFVFAEGGRRGSDLAQFPHHQAEQQSSRLLPRLVLNIPGIGSAARTNRARPSTLATDCLPERESATSTSLERQHPPSTAARCPLPCPFLRKMSPGSRPQWHRNPES